MPLVTETSPATKTSPATETAPVTDLHMHPGFTVAPVSRRMFGAFVEHMGRCVYEGIFEPGHPSADARGLRTDVLEMVRELGVSTVRYPGGNFVSGYRWEDGVGPVDQRPMRRDLAWHSREPNTFGVDEFMAWCEAAQVEPMMAVNLGTRGVQEAVELLEYCTGEAGTALADQRIANGHPEPYPVTMWCLGNEMDGPWQIGHMSARDYGTLAARTGRAMRMAAEDLELVACGTSIPDMPTFARWEREVLEAGYDTIDMISAHIYYAYDADHFEDYLRSAQKMDRQIEQVVAACDYVQAARKDPRQIMISFDEWNVSHADADRPDAGPEDPTEPEGWKPWPVAPPISESRYCAADAVVLGNLLISLLRHSDRVASASLAQLVNVLAPIRTEAEGRAWKQTIFHPFALTSRYAHGSVLDVRIDPPTPTSDGGDTDDVGADGAGAGGDDADGDSADDADADGGTADEDDAIDAVATWDEAGGQLAVFAVNRSPDSTHEVRIDLTGFGDLELAGATLIHEDDPHLLGGPDAPEVAAPVELSDVHVEGSMVRASLPAVSWGMLRLSR